MDAFGTFACGLGGSPQLRYERRAGQRHKRFFGGLGYEPHVLLLGIDHEAGCPIVIADLGTEGLQRPACGGTPLKGLHQNRRIEAKAFGQQHGFADTQQIHGPHDLVAELDGLTGPWTAAIGDVLAHGRKDRLGSIEVGAIASDKDAERALLRADGATGDRGLEESHSERLKTRADAFRGSWSDGAHIDEERPRGSAMARAFRAEQNGFDIGTIGHARDHDVATLGGRTRRVARDAAVCNDGGRAIGSSVVAAHRHPSFEQIVGHADPHQPHTEESDRGD